MAATPEKMRTVMAEFARSRGTTVTNADLEREIAEYRTATGATEDDMSRMAVDVKYNVDLEEEAEASA